MANAGIQSILVVRKRMESSQNHPVKGVVEVDEFVFG